jgi:uncharacterized protein YbjT (DUF2867 family)
MKIAITTPIGHVGSAVADFLLGRGDDVSVRLLGRRPQPLEQFVRRGAETAIGSQDDSDYLTKATQGADALFWVTPPCPDCNDFRAHQNKFGRAAAAAIRANNISRVVNLSSIGAEWASGVGPINGLHDVEALLDAAAPNITHLRPGFFFENVLMQLDSIKRSGRMSLPLSRSQRYPMIAARDIGRVAAERLADGKWTGHSVRELHGPANLSFDDLAAELSRVLGRKIEYVRCEPQQARNALLQNGMSEHMADLLLEMYAAVESGRMRSSRSRSAETTTPTTFGEFAREVILPLVGEPVAH